jgi:hypothetical protein
MKDGALRNRFQFLYMFPIGLPTEAKENIVVIPASPQQITDAFPKRKGSGQSGERADESNVMLSDIIENESGHSKTSCPNDTTQVV